MVTKIKPQNTNKKPANTKYEYLTRPRQNGKNAKEITIRDIT
jgi:hypothetical protein